MFSILLGAVGEPLAANCLDAIPAATVSFILAFALVTYLHVVLGELVPKALALSKKETLALWIAVPLECVYYVTYPIVSAPPVVGQRSSPASSGSTLRPQAS